MGKEWSVSEKTNSFIICCTGGVFLGNFLITNGGRLFSWNLPSGSMSIIYQALWLIEFSKWFCDILFTWNTVASGMSYYCIPLLHDCSFFYIFSNTIFNTEVYLAVGTKPQNGLHLFTRCVTLQQVLLLMWVGSSYEWVSVSIMT